jgi:hypothetical protein
MMGFLISNVLSHTVDLRLANSERAVFDLPFEPAASLAIRPT